MLPELSVLIEMMLMKLCSLTRSSHLNVEISCAEMMRTVELEFLLGMVTHYSFSVKHM